MALMLLGGPALEPLSLGEAKAHLRIDADNEDVLITSLVTTARLQIEAALGLALITQQWRLVMDCWPPDGIVALPLRPVQTVDAIRVVGDNEIAVLLDPLAYAVDNASHVPRLAARSGFWPIPGARLNGIEIDLTAGFGAAASDIPHDIRQALLLLVAHWYENREADSSAGTPAKIPDGVSVLLQPYKVVRV